MKKLHPRAVWLFFISGLTGWFIIFVLIFIALSIKRVAEGTGVTLPAWLWLLIAALILLSYIWARLYYHFYRYELAENAFKKELGIIAKKYVSIPYDRIQNIDIYRSLWARILGLSDLHIQTAGGTSTPSPRGGTWAFSEGNLPGLARDEAERLREELIRRSRQSRNQGL